MKLLKKRIICLLLTVVMMCGMIPRTAFATEEAEFTETAESFSIKLELSGVSSDIASPEISEGDMYYAACGDSITHANHALVTDIDADDPYYPIDGYSGTTYARKNYAYYIAESNDLQWANYGYGGTTLHHCYPKGYGGDSMRTYPFVDDRLSQLKEGIEWDYISLFFGYNDVVYGPAQQRDFWLTQTYGQELGYPVQDSQIGAEGFANAEQKAACDAVTGSVGGVEYTDNTEYFFAKFVGTVDDTETTTFLGAYNYALDYLTEKYPHAKIMIVNPYVGGTNNTRKIIRNGINAIAEKWGVSCMDFNDLPYWFYRVDQKRVEFPNPNREDGRWYAENGKANYAGTVEGYNRARFTTDGTHPSNLGYQTISKPMERALIGTNNTVNVLQGEPFETELVLDDIYTDMNVSVTMGGSDITDRCYADGKIRIESVMGDVIIRAEGNITYTTPHTHSYTSTVTAPTCTEQGYTTYTCDCGDSYVDDYAEAIGHNYEIGICTVCGAKHPNFEEEDQLYSELYSTIMAELCHNQQIHCVITDAYGNTITAETATISHSPIALDILSPSQDTQISIGEKYSVTVETKRDGLTYQRYYRETEAGEFNVPNFQDMSYSMSFWQNDRQIYCVITDQYGTVSKPTMGHDIPKQPADIYADIVEKSGVGFGAPSNGLSYQWYYKDAGVSEFKISDSHSSTYSMTVANWQNSRQVYCVITDRYGNTVTTDIMTIRVEYQMILKLLAV